MNRPPNDAPPADAAASLSRQKPASMAKYKRELRKEIRRNAAEPEINFLNITAMLDMMTIILVFLLKTISASPTKTPQDADLKMPSSQIAIDLKKEPEGLPILVSKSRIVVGIDRPRATIDVPADADTYGAAAKDKTRNRQDVYINPLGLAVRSWRDDDKAFRESIGKPGSSEAIIMADETTPYRLLVEVLYTLGQNEFGQFHLMVLQSAKK